MNNYLQVHAILLSNSGSVSATGCVDVSNRNSL